MLQLAVAPAETVNVTSIIIVLQRKYWVLGTSGMLGMSGLGGSGKTQPISGVPRLMLYPANQWNSVTQCYVGVRQMSNRIMTYYIM